MASKVMRRKQKKRRLTMQQLQYGGRPRMQDILYVQGHGRCWYCGDKLRYTEITVDHKNPVVRGGATVETNLVCCCAACNARKGCLTVEEFRYAEGVRQFYGEQGWLPPQETL